VSEETTYRIMDTVRDLLALHGYRAAAAAIERSKRGIPDVPIVFGSRPEAPAWHRPDELLPPHCEHVLGVCAGRVFRCWYNERTKKWHADPGPKVEWDIKLWAPLPKPPA
jgi:hypothetical protein